ncbi:hypothetical protein EDD18DRAFT_1109457 [Armillaria luteobubalina]|uniref:BTB domain-containing protein n=1 Tax=Armillaria luteobubalina TaxID=153913 RepID=A0AA39PXZ2_9AGAR|nr:hypothetical protein EDD18DRAFT_1109457 [Armillaria luteobubalina]
MVSQEPYPTYHPTFNSPDANIILSSLNGTLYRLPSSVLRWTTTFFASPSFTFEPSSKPIPIHEHDAVLERLLRIISGLAIPPWRTFDDLEGELSLAGTWGARGAVDIVRIRQGCVIVARFGWEEEAELASRHTLELSLHEEQYQERLRWIPMCALVRLFKFHRKRRDEFQVGMQGEGHVMCAGCGKVVDVGSVGSAGMENVLGDGHEAIGG